jgi:hypothetical protein
MIKPIYLENQGASWTVSDVELFVFITKLLYAFLYKNLIYSYAGGKFNPARDICSVRFPTQRIPQLYFLSI